MTVFLVVGVLFLLVALWLLVFRNRRKMSAGKRSRLNFFFTIGVTLALTVFAVVYNNVILHNVSVVNVYENGEQEVKTNATELENYLTLAVTTLRVAADSVDIMEKNGRSIEEIYQYVTDQTKMQSEQFDENFTGIYAFINGKYMDGSGWIPPADYEPTSRDWYKEAVKAKGETVIVPPYVDAQTGQVVVTIAKCISDSSKGGNGKLKNVVCLDVIVKHIKEVTQKVSIAEKGYGLVINKDGFIIAHREEKLNGKKVADVYDQELLNRILQAKEGRITAKVDGKDCTLFISPVMGQWYSVIVIDSTELFEAVNSQLAINILVSLITFGLISFFYYVGYKNEQIYREKVEEMNIQVVSSLASAIDAKDNYTNGHSSRVAKYSRMLAERAGYSEPEQDEIYMIGLLHDVGKIGVPDSVINKPSKLTAEEFEQIKKHPVVGSGILASIKDRPKLATAPDGITNGMEAEAIRMGSSAK